jgi:hypothetical protein
MEKTIDLGRNGYGDPRFEVKVFENGSVQISERDPHSSRICDSIFLRPTEVAELLDALKKV